MAESLRKSFLIALLKMYRDFVLWGSRVRRRVGHISTQWKSRSIGLKPEETFSDLQLLTFFE